MRNPGWLTLSAILILGTTTRAQLVAYTDENAFLSALSGMGVPAVHEGFEDDAVWGGVRSTVVGGSMTAPSVSNLGITWTSNSVNNAVTTSNGAAKSGQWGFYSLPHGDYANGITDGILGTGDQPLVAIGGWVRTNTPFAKMDLELDGVPVGFGAAAALGTQYEFFGAIDPNGFSQFHFVEQEGTIGDQKFVFFDDFTFGFGGTIVDCNGNNVSDVLDIANGTSSDCDNDAVPDECQIDAASTAPGGPFFCQTGCDPDCNGNGVPDLCETTVPQVYSSGQMGPIGFGSPQTFTVVAPPASLGNVVLDFTAIAKLDGTENELLIDVNGTFVGTAFTTTGNDCGEFGVDTARLVVPAAVFNGAVAGGDAQVTAIGSPEVDPLSCNPSSWVQMTVTLYVPGPLDTNGNGVPDACEGTLYCTGKVNGLGCSPQIGVTGTPSASDPDPYDFRATNVLNRRNGLPFYGVNGPASAPFFGGTLCVMPPLRRLAIQNSGGSPPPANDCSGQYLLDFNALIQGGTEPLLVPGQPVNAQWWTRDPLHPDGTGVGLTPAVQFVIGV